MLSNMLFNRMHFILISYSYIDKTLMTIRNNLLLNRLVSFSTNIDYCTYTAMYMYTCIYVYEKLHNRTNRYLPPNCNTE